MTDRRTASVPPLVAGLLCRCPQCGDGRLFAGYLTVADRCSVCGLALKVRDTGDGPAVFVVLIVGAIVVGAALIVEIALAPPLWLHALLWAPAILALSLALLRPFKGVFYAITYQKRPDAP
ncbi:MAG: DUF983 domain-containing protein [Alphaproteobacteria bacterium]|nr:DUF983 domain-containing protein [Alphaproteobacteria bacterium]